MHTLSDRGVRFNFHTTLCRRRFVDGVVGVLRGEICGRFGGNSKSEIGGNGCFLRLGTGLFSGTKHIREKVAGWHTKTDSVAPDLPVHLFVTEPTIVSLPTMHVAYITIVLTVLFTQIDAVLYMGHIVVMLWNPNFNNYFNMFVGVFLDFAFGN